MNKEDEEYLRMIEEDIALAKAEGRMANQSPMSPAMYSMQNKQNLVEWQLDFKPELESIERSLRNDVLVKDPRTGAESWQVNPDKDKILLNDLGVSDVLKKVVMLINKNKVLSNYSEEQIQMRVKYISHAIRELIYLNYEYYDMNNEYKWNCYYSLVVDLDDMIESAYRRALNGEERRDLNQARMVQQNDPVMPNNAMGMYPMMMQSQKKKHWYNPLSWTR